MSNFWVFALFLVEFACQISLSSSFTKYQTRGYANGGGGGGGSIQTSPGSGGPDRLGCFWSRLTTSTLNGTRDRLECHVRTLNTDFWNVTDLGNESSSELTKENLLTRATSLRVKCNDKLLFESFLLPNQTMFGMVNLLSVDIESCKIRKLPGNVWSTLGFLKSLTIRSKNGDWSTSVSLELENEAFQGLGQLTRLDLSENNIWSLPDRIFCPLRSLEGLNVSQNRLSELEELNGSSGSNYCMLNTVQNVDLSYNSLRRIGKIVKWKKITELRLQNNYIEELDDNAFSELTHLKLVNLSSNRLVAIPPAIFRFNSGLKEINLANNSLSAVAPAVFSGLDQLVRLDMSRNTLTSQWIRDKMFHGLTRLVVLRLSFNQLSSVDSSIFRDLVSLQVLNLDNNRIEAIHPDAFSILATLHFLDLSSNRIIATNYRIFGHLTNLKQLYLDHNKIRQIDDELLANCTSLQDLGLADNLLLEVPVALRAGLSHLQTLDIGENRITSINNESFSGLGQLFGLRMVDNRLTEVPRGFCDPLTKLRVLNFAQNRIQRISSSSFTSCPDLRALRLDTNTLEDLPTTLVAQLPSLLWLNVSENRLNSVDYRTIPPTVEWLDLSHNRLQAIRGLVETQKSQINLKLRILDVSYNRLTQLDYTSIPGSLETLRVNHNQVKSVAPDSFIRSNSLMRVELKANELETLPLTALRFPPVPVGRRLPEISLSANPFRCDCSMEWLTRVGQLSTLRQHPRIVDLDAISCSPIFARNTTLTSNPISLRTASASNFLCPYKSHCFALCHCCDFDACDCEMTCPGNCTCYHDTAWTRNVVDCSSSGHQDIPARIPMDATELYLDGNHIPSLTSHIFIGKKNLRTLYFNNSRIEFIRNKTLNGLKSLERLHLENNLLTELQGFEFTDVENLKQLYLQNNMLRLIAPDTFASLKSLEILRLDGNQLVSFSVWELGGHGLLTSAMLAGNPWSCHCEFMIAFRTWIFSHSSTVPDLSELTCQTMTHDSTEDNASASSAVIPIASVCQAPSDSSINFKRGESITINGFNVNDQMILSDDHQQVSVSHFPMVNGMEKSGSVSRESNIDTGSGALNSGQSPANSQSGTDLRTSNMTEDNSGLYWAVSLTIGGFVVFLIFLLILFRKEIMEHLNNKMNLILWCCSGCCPSDESRGHNGHPSGKGKTKKPSSLVSSDDMEKLFDAYFLYSKKDEDLLLEKVTPELESGIPNFFRLCLHHRDLSLIPDNPWNHEMIQSASDASKRIVLILSQNFLHSEWANGDFRSSIQFVLSRPEIQKKLIMILMPPLTEQNLVNFLPAIYPDLSLSLQMMSGSGLSNKGGLSSLTGFGFGSNHLKSCMIEWTDKNFWSKFKLLMPTPLHSSILHSADHPMLIPATYTISRLHSHNRNSSPNGDYSHHHHSLNMNQLQHQSADQEYQIQCQQQQQRNNLNLSLPSYNQSTGMSSHQSQNQNQQQQLQVPTLNYPGSHHSQPPPPPLPPGWGGCGFGDSNNSSSISGSTASSIGHRAIHPLPNQLTPQLNFTSFNESFKRHQQSHLNHHLHQQQQLLRLQSKPKSKKPHHHHQHSNNNNSHNHQHQDSNCSNISNNSRRPLNASPGYSSSVETNLSSSNEELDHVYSTLDSPLHSPNNNVKTSSVGLGSGFQVSVGSNGEIGEHLNLTNNSSMKLINPYSPTNINNNGDPTMYFV